jgi:UDP-2,4-diacetamido-2,4,6-trideoxy-beta-L-altropyranose hydrolase
MRILFRSDASALIGAGHHMRCLALAQACKRLGGSVFFAMATSLDSTYSRFRKEDFGIEFFEVNAGSEADATLTRQLAQKLDCDWIVLDGYDFRDRYQAILKPFTGSVLAIDDFGQCETWSVQAILNYNFFADSIRYAGVNETQILRGPMFALIREELIERAYVASEQRKANRVLVTLGGSDVTELVVRIVALLNEYRDQFFEIRIVIGSACDARVIQEFIGKIGHAYELVIAPMNMAIHYAWADRVICAAGSTCFECLHFRLPMAVVGIAENQSMNLAALRGMELATFLGWRNEIDHSAMFRFLNSERDDEIPVGIVDGLGAARIAQFMLSSVR